jgi:hypothetical protein
MITLPGLISNLDLSSPLPGLIAMDHHTWLLPEFSGDPDDSILD